MAIIAFMEGWKGKAPEANIATNECLLSMSAVTQSNFKVRTSAKQVKKTEYLLCEREDGNSLTPKMNNLNPLSDKQRLTLNIQAMHPIISSFFSSEASRPLIV